MWNDEAGDISQALAVGVAGVRHALCGRAWQTSLTTSSNALPPATMPCATSPGPWPTANPLALVAPSTVRCGERTQGQEAAGPGFLNPTTYYNVASNISRALQRGEVLHAGLQGLPLSERQHTEYGAGVERGGDAEGVRGVQSGCLVLHIRRSC